MLCWQSTPSLRMVGRPWLPREVSITRSELSLLLVSSHLTLQHHLQNIPACFRGSENCLGPAARLLDDVTGKEGEMCLAQARIIHSRHMRNGETGANN